MDRSCRVGIACSLVVIGCLVCTEHYAQRISDPTHILGHGKTSTSVYQEIRRAREPLILSQLRQVTSTSQDGRFKEGQVDLEEIRQAMRRGTGGERWKALLPHRQEDRTHYDQLIRVGEKLEECEFLKYPTRFANELRLGVRENPTVEQIFKSNVMLPEVDTAREYWTPSVEQAI